MTSRDRNGDALQQDKMGHNGRDNKRQRYCALHSLFQWSFLFESLLLGTLKDESFKIKRE